MEKLKKFFTLFIPSVEAGNYLETFFISAVSSLLLVRYFLAITGYPQLGGANLHIAHVLWGGFFMMLALLMMLIFLNKEAKQLGAVLGGVGFGMFIDELGKFITSDNNYLYRPAMALIYVVFVLLFLGIRAAEKYLRVHNSKAYAVNALELAKEAVLEDLNAEEQEALMEYLSRADAGNPIINDLKTVLAHVKQDSSANSMWWTKARLKMKAAYWAAVKKVFFTNAVITVSVIYFFFSFSLAVWNLGRQVSFSSVGELFFTLFSGWFMLSGIHHLINQRRLEAYGDLKKSITISIFLTQFFLFLNQQLWGSLGLLWYLLALFVLKYLIDQEKVLTQPVSGQAG